MESKLDSFLLPLCCPRDNVSILEKVGADPIFDRNVIGVVAQFAKELNPCFLRKWASDDPFGVAVLARSQDRGHPTQDLVFVSNNQHRVQSFRGDGTVVKQWGSKGVADGQFNNIAGVAVLQKHPTRNLIFVTDLANDRVQVFSGDGAFIRKWGSYGKRDGEFNGPYGVTVHPTQELVYITDHINHRVQVFDADGAFIRKWGTTGSGNGQFYYPGGVVVHPTRDLIFISEPNRIQAFRSDGTFLFKWGSRGSADGQFQHSAGIALHPTRELLFVADSSNHRVQIFNLNGVFLTKWGSEGKADGEFEHPWSIGLHPTNDLVDNVSILEKVGADPIFDRNVIGVVAQFAQEWNPCFIRKWKSDDPFGVAVLARSQDRILAQSKNRDHTPSQDRDLARSQDRGQPTQDLVFVTDTQNHRVQSFRNDGSVVSSWGSKGSADGQFKCPGCVAVLARSQDGVLARSQDGVVAQSQDGVLQKHPTRNLIFVTDLYNHRIQVFNVDGSFIRKWGSRGQGNGQFDRPHAVAVHPTQELVYVTDHLNHRVQVFNANGTFIRKWGTRGTDNGQFHYPCGVAVHPTRDLIFISEAIGHRIQVFRSDGTFLFKWGSQGSADGQFQQLEGLAFHSSRDLLFVVDAGNHRVQVFNLDGTFVCKWGSQGTVDGEFDYCPWGVAVHPTDNLVYVSDNNHVHEFSLFPTMRKRKRVADI